MTKYHKIISVAISLVFLIMLQELSVPQPIFRFLLPSFLLFGIVITWYHTVYLKKIDKYNIWILARPLLFFGTAFNLFLIIPTAFLRGSFLIFAFLLGAAVEAFLGNFAENVLLNETLIIAFGIFTSLAAYLEYFPKYQTVYLVAVFVATFFVTRAFYEFVPQSPAGKLLASLGISLFLTELFWACSFLPLHYSAIAIMMFNVFYFFLVLNYYYVFNTLTIRKLQLHALLLALCSGFVFLLTPWRILG